MLLELRVAGFGVIDEISLTFGPGLNVLTGETGTGKSVLVRALAWVLGAADVRPPARDADESAAETSVEARFDCGPDVANLLEDAGIPVDDEIVVSRRTRSGGRRVTTQSYVNGAMVTAGQLAAIGAGLVEAVGQHSSRSILQASAQRGALDRYGCGLPDGGRHGAALARVEVAYGRLRALRDEAEALGGDPVALARESDLLRFQLEEIDGVAPEPDEDVRLSGELRLLSNADAVKADLASAAEAAAAARDAAATASAHAGRADDPRAEGAGASLRESLALLDDAAGEFRALVEATESDPQRLDVVQRRIAALRELRRKYGPGLDDVFAFAESARGRLEAIRHSGTRVAELDGEIAAAEEELDAAAADLAACRRAAAASLVDDVGGRLGDLAMQGARFEVRVEDSGRRERHGGDDVTFAFSASSTSPPAPLAKVASGGETSRVMLALSSALAELEAPPTIVFDEIDAGIGGTTALAVGRALAELSARRQLLCITHLAQVASFASAHVALHNSDGHTTASVVEGEARLVELSRMLSGSPDSRRSRQSVKELLESAQDVLRTAGQQ